MTEILSIGWIGTNNQLLNVMDIPVLFQPGTKTTLNEWSLTSPALARSGSGVALIAYNDDDHLVLYTDPQFTTAERSPAAPAAASGRLGAVADMCLAWIGTGNRYLNVMIINNPASKQTFFSETSPTAPALAAFGNSLWIAWIGTGNTHLNVMDVNNPASKQTFLSETSPAAPALGSRVIP